MSVEKIERYLEGIRDLIDSISFHSDDLLAKEKFDEADKCATVSKELENIFTKVI